MECRLKIKAVNFLNVIIHIYHMKLLIPRCLSKRNANTLTKVLYDKCTTDYFSVF